MIEKLMRDGAVYVLAAIFSRGVAFLLVPFYTRLLDAAHYGALELILTGGLLVNLIVALEIGQGLAREWPDQDDPTKRRSLASTALMFTVITHGSFLVLALAASGPLATALLGSPEFEPELRTGLVFIAVNAVFLQLQNQLRWDLRARSYAAVSLLYGGLTLALATWLGRLGGLQGVLCGQALAAGFACAVGLGLLRAQLGLILDRGQLARMLRFSLPLVPSGAAVFATFYVNRLMLSSLSTLSEVGIFGVGQRIAALATLLIVGVQGALTPLIYRHYRQPEVPAQLARILEGFVAVAMIVCLLLSVFARELVDWIVTPEFSSAAALVPWLTPAALLSQMYIFAPGIAIARKTMWQLSLTLVSAALAVGLNLMLIPMWGAVGAAVASCAAAAWYLGTWVAASQRTYALPLRWLPLTLAFVAYVGLAWSGLRVDRTDWPPEVRFPLKILVVVAMSGVLGLAGLLRWRRAVRERDPQPPGDRRAVSDPKESVGGVRDQVVAGRPRAEL